MITNLVIFGVANLYMCCLFCDDHVCWDVILVLSKFGLQPTHIYKSSLSELLAYRWRNCHCAKSSVDLPVALVIERTGIYFTTINGNFDMKMYTGNGYFKAKANIVRNWQIFKRGAFALGLKMVPAHYQSLRIRFFFWEGGYCLYISKSLFFVSQNVIFVWGGGEVIFDPMSKTGEMSRSHIFGGGEGLSFLILCLNLMRFQFLNFV